MSGTLLFGGSFDPIHHGHLIVARAVAERLGLNVLLIPSANPPHKRAAALAPASERLAMCARAVAGERGLSVSDWELRAGGTSYTLRTVEHFAREAGYGSLYWLIGMDTLHALHTWYEIGRLAELCTFVTARRPGSVAADVRTLRLSEVISAEALARVGAHVVEAPEIGISSTDVRARVARGASVRYLVPDAVADYIAERGLYRGG